VLSTSHLLLIPYFEGARR